ncbi:hypothetical protein D3C77_262680 [compost metagenome]
MAACSGVNWPLTGAARLPCTNAGLTDSTRPDWRAMRLRLSPRSPAGISKAWVALTLLSFCANAYSGALLPRAMARASKLGRIMESGIGCGLV